MSRLICPQHPRGTVIRTSIGIMTLPFWKRLPRLAAEEQSDCYPARLRVTPSGVLVVHELVPQILPDVDVEPEVFHRLVVDEAAGVHLSLHFQRLVFDALIVKRGRGAVQSTTVLNHGFGQRMARKIIRMKNEDNRGRRLPEHAFDLFAQERMRYGSRLRNWMRGRRHTCAM
jgi:hypothetical protein